MLITLAPWSVAQTIPDATQLVFPDPSSPNTFPITRLELYPNPATPAPLFVDALAIPAVWVPCPFRSATSVANVPVKFFEATIFPCKSGCPVKTPVSKTAIFTIDDPCVISHADGALTMESAYWDGTCGSFGVSEIVFN